MVRRMHLNDGFASQYVGCSADNRRKLDYDLILAQKWLDVVIVQISIQNNKDVATKINNIFSIDVGLKAHSTQYAMLLNNFKKLRLSMDSQLTFECVKVQSVNGAWVDTNQPSKIFLPLNYFKLAQDERTAKLIHERSHIVLSTKHSGMSAGGTITFGEAPDDPKGFTITDALDNAYCYEYLTISLQPNYRPDRWRY